MSTGLSRRRFFRVEPPLIRVADFPDSLEKSQRFRWRILGREVPGQRLRDVGVDDVGRLGPMLRNGLLGECRQDEKEPVDRPPNRNHLRV